MNLKVRKVLKTHRLKCKQNAKITQEDLESIIRSGNPNSLIIQDTIYMIRILFCGSFHVKEIGVTISCQEPRNSRSLLPIKLMFMKNVLMFLIKDLCLIEMS